MFYVGKASDPKNSGKSLVSLFKLNDYVLHYRLCIHQVSYSFERRKILICLRDREKTYRFSKIIKVLLLLEPSILLPQLELLTESDLKVG